MRPLFLLLFFNLSFSIYSQIPKNNLAFDIEMKKALSFFKKKEYSLFKKHTDKALLLTKKNKEKQKAHYYLGAYYKYQHLSDSAYYHYNKSKNLLLKIGDTVAAGRRLFSIASIQHRSNDYLGSEINAIQALRYLKDSKSNDIKSNLYTLLGNIYCDRKEPLEALKYYDISLSFFNDSIKNINHKKTIIINNKGLAFQRVEQNKKAIRYFQKGLNYDSVKIKYPKIYSLLIENLGWSNFRLKNYKNVLQYYKEALHINDSLNDLEGKVRTNINISHFYKETKKNFLAKKHAKIALNLSNNTHFNKEHIQALELLAELSPKEQSSLYLKAYTKKKDESIQKERRLKNQFAKIRYETEEKEKENVLLKIENNKKQAEITREKQQKTIGWLVAIAGLLLFGLSTSFFTLRRRKFIYEAQLQKIEARENERQQIAKSLHDEVAGDLRLLHQKLQQSNLLDEAKKLNAVKNNVRNLSHQLSSISFKEVSFKDQVINLVSDYFSIDFKIKVTGTNDIEWININDSVKRLLYLSTREIIQNCKKHAEANLITIDFSIHKKAVFLSITDNGKGFNLNNSKKGIGLKNLQERVNDLNGTLRIKSELGNGTKTTIRIPLNA